MVAQQLKYAILTVLLTQCVHAINLGFFGSLSRTQNKSMQASSRQTTTSPITKKLSTIKFNPNVELDSTTKSPVTTTSTAIEKHELENEFTPSTTEGDQCGNVTNTNKTSGQEIDETNLNECPLITPTTNGTTINTTTPGSGLEIDETKKNIQEFPLGSFIPPIPQISLPNLPQIIVPKQKTIIITNTVIKPYTEYKIVNPSCLKLEHVTGICKGNLITIRPTPTVRHERTTRSESHYEVHVPYEVEESPQETDEDDSSLSTKPTIDESDKSSGQAHNFDKDNVLEASELDYDFEEISLPERRIGNNGKSPTPLLPSVNGDTLIQRIRVMESLPPKRPKIIYITEYINSVTTYTTTDHVITTTIIASKCVPRNLNLPTCTPFPIIPTFPFLLRSDELIMNLEGERNISKH